MSGTRRLVASVLLSSLLTVLSQPPHGFSSPLEQNQPAPAVSHGVASGDVTPTSAVVWARAARPAMMRVEYDTSPAFRSPGVARTAVNESTDLTGQVLLEELSPGTEYHYRVRFEVMAPNGATSASPYTVGRFRTPPEPTEPTALSFVFSGDLGGFPYCRPADSGYTILGSMADLAPDFFLATGDMIYADTTCPAVRPDGRRNLPKPVPDVDSAAVDWSNRTRLREIYGANWRYNREDAHLQRLLAATPVYAQWDDHEVINNFGASWEYWNEANRERAGYANLVEIGREYFFNYTPTARDRDEPARIYRQFSWGRDVDLFILDTRSYRSRNELEDTNEEAKSLLGSEQLAWLRAGLEQSRATWKLVASGLPISARSAGTPASGVDGWTGGPQGDAASRTGFRRELAMLLGALDAMRVRNVVFLAGDAHRALAIHYETDFDGDGIPLSFHEFIAGPLSANPGGLNNPQLDRTFNPTILYGRGELFNFGHVQVATDSDGLSRLSFAIVDELGTPQPGSEIELRAQPG